MKLTIDLDGLSYAFRDIPDKKRLELIKILLFTSNDMHATVDKLKKYLDSEKFKEMID